MEPHVRRERRFLLAFLLVTGALVLWVTRAYLGWAVLGLVVGHVLTPLHEKLAARMRTRERAALVVVFVALLALVIPLIALGYAIADDVADLAATVQAQGLPQLLAAGLSRVLEPSAAAAYSALFTAKLESFGVALAPKLVSAAADAGIGLFILGSTVYAFLSKREKLANWVERLLPMRPDRERALFREIGQGVDAVVYGIVVVAAAQAAVAGVVWMIAGMPNPVFWTVVMFVLSMIPVVGPFVVMLPAAAWSAMNGDWWAAGVLAVGAVLFVGLVDNWLRPIVIGRKGGLDSTLVLISTVGGLAALGPVGIFAGPLLVAVFLHVVDVTVESREEAGGDYVRRVPVEEEPAPAPEGEPEAE